MLTCPYVLEAFFSDGGQHPRSWFCAKVLNQVDIFQILFRKQFPHFVHFSISLSLSWQLVSWERRDCVTLIGALWITINAHAHLSQRQLINQDVNIVQGHRTAPVGNSARDCVWSIRGGQIMLFAYVQAIGGVFLIEDACQTIQQCALALTLFAASVNFCNFLKTISHANFTQRLSRRAGEGFDWVKHTKHIELLRRDQGRSVVQPPGGGSDNRLLPCLRVRLLQV